MSPKMHAAFTALKAMTAEVVLNLNLRRVL